MHHFVNESESARDASVISEPSVPRIGRDKSCEEQRGWLMMDRPQGEQNPVARANIVLIHFRSDVAAAN